MGHVLLGDIPRTRPWQKVVGLLRGGAGAAQVANATVRAAEEALRFAGTDPGVIESTWLLMRLPFVARGPHFVAGLRTLGLDVSDSPGLLEVSGAVSAAVERAIANAPRRSPTDVGEMAQHAASQVLTESLGKTLPNLFGVTSEEVRGGLAQYATVKQFGQLARQFFAGFMNRCLGYCLSRELSNHVGQGERFPSLAASAAFTTAMETHCREAAVIVERYSGEWLSKANWESGGHVDRKQVKNFASYAMTKLTDELKRGAVAHG